MTVETARDHQVPAAGAYVDPDRYEAERRAIFAREWTAVGTVDQVAGPSVHVTRPGWRSSSRWSPTPSP